MSLDFFFAPLATKVGASLDQVKLITCLLVSYPLASLFIRLPASQPTLKHVFNIAVASFYFVPVLNQGWPFLLLLGDVLATYFIALTVQGPRMPWIVFGLMMGHLFWNHVDRALYGDPFDGSYNITGPQMVLVMKLTTFAWNAWDGRRPVEDLDKWQTKMRVAKFPSLLEFLGFSLYFPGVLVGPFLEYAAYLSLINGTSLDAADGSEPRGQALPNGRKRAAYRKMLLALGFLGFYMGVAPKISFQTPITDWFLQQNLLYKILVVQLAGFVERSRYYSVWILTEGASILTGLGFTGYSPSGVATWNGAANVDVWKIEIPENSKMLVDSWNIKTNVWLRECVYKRVTPKGQKAGFQSSMLTYLTSAIWHGVSAGYYLTFMLGGFLTTVARLARSTVRPLFLPTVSGPTGSKAANGHGAAKPPTPPRTVMKTAYDVAGTVCTLMVVNFICIPHILLHLSDSVEAWRRLHWYGLLMVFGPMTFFYGGGVAWLKGIQANRLRRANATVNGPGTPGVAPTVPPVDAVFRAVEKKLS